MDWTWRKGRWHFTPDVAVKNGEDNSPENTETPAVAVAGIDALTIPFCIFLS